MKRPSIFLVLGFFAALAVGAVFYDGTKPVALTEDLTNHVGTMALNGNITNLTIRGWLSVPVKATNTGGLYLPNITANALAYIGSDQKFTELSEGGQNTLLHGASPPSYSAIVEADLSLSDTTTANVSTSKHGLTPKLPGDNTKYLDGQGSFSTPSGGGSSTGYVFNANQFGANNVSNISVVSGVLLTNPVIYGTAAGVAQIINTIANPATNTSEIWSNGVLMQNVDSSGWTRIYTRNTNNAPQDAVSLVNSNLGTGSGVQIYSPAERFRGYGWKTTATAAYQPVDWRIYNQPVQGAAAPTANFLFDYAVNDGSFATKFTFSSAGAFTTAGSITGGSGFDILCNAGNFGSLNASYLNLQTDGNCLLRNNALNNFTRLQFGGTTATFPSIGRNGAGFDFYGAAGVFAPTNNGVFGGQLTCTNLDNGGWSVLRGPSTNISTVNLPTNNASFNTIAPSGANTVALGSGWTNNLGARADLVIAVKYVDAATGDPAFSFTNTVTGEAWTNSIAFGLTATTKDTVVIPDISPSDYGSFTDLSGAGSSVTFMKAWWKLK